MATSNTLDLHSNWLTVGEALLATKKALEPYVQKVADDWHQMLLKRFKKKGSCASPSSCNPPMSLCRCCEVWYRELHNRHKGDPAKISWNNTNCTKWAQKQQGAWEVAKVYMAYLGKMKSQVIDAKSTDIAGLLNILRFYPNEAFGNPVSRPYRSKIEDVTSKARNPWAHSARHEMTTIEKQEALRNLKLLLQDNVLKSSPAAGEALQDLQKLDSDGITNIAISENNCLKLLTLELPAEVSKIKADVENLKSTSQHDIRQVKSTISGISSSVVCIESQLKTLEEQSELLVLKEDLRELEHELENKMTNMEKSQEQLEARQNIVEENLDEVNTRLQDLSEKVQTGAVCEPLQSRLPDFQDKVFGRDADIEHISGLVRDYEKPCVVLTGAPGFGKTTLAINLAHKLEISKVFLFQSLREMRLTKDVCSALLAQVGRHPKENEKEELLRWARSLKEKVVFILDNAEDALQIDKDAFINLLQELRTNSRSNIQFLITSRERFAFPLMEVTNVEIKQLNTEEGIKVIRSMVPDGYSCGDLNVFEELVNLCGGIPLALRMIGSILECYDDVTSLIQDLKSFPMETLEDTTLPSYHQSVRAAFECSFQKLNESLRAHLVRLSVFRGPFTQQAAVNILDCKPVMGRKVLKELTNKSLLTKLNSTTRYEMHSLVQKYIMDVKRESYKNDFDAATSKFIDFYASVVIEGHELFWSKDNFKRSIEMLRNDSLNIEIALEKCYEDAEKMRKFFSIVWPVSMYLEMCISLEKLNTFLESCSRSAASQNKNGVEMEAQCFLAYYEWKKTGYSGKYERLFNNARKLYEKEENSLSPSHKWLYKHSYGLLLNQQKKNDEAFQVTKEAQQIAELNTDATDLPLTLNQLGNIEKHRKNFDEAKLWLEESHENRIRVLGEQHILSVPKHLADLYLQLKKYGEAFALYEKALDTYKAIDMDEEKQCIYLLKNMGSCCLQLGKVDQSLEYFHKAMELVDRLLEGDQRVKMLLYSELAQACFRRDRSPQAGEYAQNALDMADRLGISCGGQRHMEMILKKLEEGEQAE